MKIENVIEIAIYVAVSNVLLLNHLISGHYPPGFLFITALFLLTVFAIFRLIQVEKKRRLSYGIHYE